MTIPVIYSIARANPGTRFVFLTRRSMASMMVNAPENLEVEGVDLHEPRYRGISGIRQLYRDVRQKHRFDIIADLHGVLRTWQMSLWARLDGIKTVGIRKGRAHRRALTRPNNKVMLPLTSQRDRYREVFHRLGLKVTKDFTSLFPENNEKRRAVGIAPFAAHRGKIYPVEMMEEVVKKLDEKGIETLLFGAGGNEASILESWASKYPHATSLAGKKLGFDKELELMSQLEVMVSMDSANMHMASMVGVPVVSVWGATHPYGGFKGFHQKPEDCVQLAMTCRPCSIFGDKPCSRGDYHCMRGISPESILKRVMAHLGPS